MKIPYLDLRITDENELNSLMQAVKKVFLHGRFINGPELIAFEEEIAKFCNRNYAIGVNSGTDALILGLMALGIGSGDEVIVPAFTWIATANAVKIVGATPVFADVNEDLNISPQNINKFISDKTKAIIPVHYTGKICEIDTIQEIAKKNNLILIEDASQAFGAKYNDKLSCTFGDMACVSLNPMKVFAACGESGVVLTDSEEVMQKLKALRYNGMVDRLHCEKAGLNGRMDTIQASILLERFKRFRNVIEKRRQIADIYSNSLVSFVKTPKLESSFYNVFYSYIIQTDQRDELRDYLLQKGIEVQTRDGDFIPGQPAYKEKCVGEWKNAELLWKKLICLPCHEKMTVEDAKLVVDSVEGFFDE